MGTTKIAFYEQDAKLRPALDALAKVRDADRGSAAWWTEMSSESASFEEEQAMWVKMSEYLCLIAHIEALAVAAEKLPEAHCLVRSAGLRTNLASELQALREREQ